MVKPEIEPSWFIGVTIKEMEKFMVLETLKYYKGNKTQAAKALGISLRTMRDKVKRYQAP